MHKFTFDFRLFLFCCVSNRRVFVTIQKMFISLPISRDEKSSEVYIHEVCFVLCITWISLFIFDLYLLNIMVSFVYGCLWYDKTYRAAKLTLSSLFFLLLSNPKKPSYIYLILINPERTFNTFKYFGFKYFGFTEDGTPYFIN